MGDSNIIETPTEVGDIDKTKVDIAARFLRNSNVKETEKENQETFLKNKGLSQAEIDLAFQNAFEQETNEELSASSWSVFDYLKGVVLGSGLLSAANYAYKAYVLPYATRELKDDARIESLVESLQSVKDDIKQHTHELGGTLKQMQSLMEENQNSLKSIASSLETESRVKEAPNTNELKAELSNIKNMMLSKDQFRDVPVKAVKRIPAWQQIAEDMKADEGLPEPVKEGSDVEKGNDLVKETETDDNVAVEPKTVMPLEPQVDEESADITVVESESKETPDTTTFDIVNEENIDDAVTPDDKVTPISSDESIRSDLSSSMYEVVPTSEQIDASVSAEEITEDSNGCGVEIEVETKTSSTSVTSISSFEEISREPSELDIPTDTNLE